jgi:hypothetical protein
MAVPASYIGLSRQLQQLPEATQSYLAKVSGLLSDGNNFDVALSYVAMKLEEGHHRALKCGLIRIHKCHSGTVDRVLDEQHFTHESFHRVFVNVFGLPIPKPALTAHKEYTSVRNKIIHGKRFRAKDLRAGIHYSLKYIDALGGFVEHHTDKNPYGDLRGLVARQRLLPTNSTEWMLRGFLATK